MQRETEAQRLEREAVQYVAAHPLGLRFAAGFIAPLFDPDDGSVYNAGKRSIAIKMWGAFVAHARPSLVPLLNEIFREQQPSGRSSTRADAADERGDAARRRVVELADDTLAWSDDPDIRADLAPSG